MDLTDIPKRREGLTERLVAGERVVLDPDTKAMHQLNITATMVWERCDGVLSVGSIAEKLVEQFGIAEDLAERDVSETVAKFRSLGLLEP